MKDELTPSYFTILPRVDPGQNTDYAIDRKMDI